jgi:hypothetical protein
MRAEYALENPRHRHLRAACFENVNGLSKRQERENRLLNRIRQKIVYELPSSAITYLPLCTA